PGLFWASDFGRAPNASRRAPQHIVCASQYCRRVAHILYRNAIRRLVDAAVYSVLVSVLDLASCSANEIPPSVPSGVCAADCLAGLRQDHRSPFLRRTLLYAVPMRARGMGT